MTKGSCQVKCAPDNPVRNVFSRVSKLLFIINRTDLKLKIRVWKRLASRLAVVLRADQLRHSEGCLCTNQTFGQLQVSTEYAPVNSSTVLCPVNCALLCCLQWSLCLDTEQPPSQFRSPQTCTFTSFSVFCGNNKHLNTINVPPATCLNISACTVPPVNIQSALQRPAGCCTLGQ